MPLAERTLPQLARAGRRPCTGQRPRVRGEVSTRTSPLQPGRIDRDCARRVLRQQRTQRRREHHRPRRNGESRWLHGRSHFTLHNDRVSVSLMPLVVNAGCAQIGLSAIVYFFTSSKEAPPFLKTRSSPSVEVAMITGPAAVSAAFSPWRGGLVH